MKHVKLGIFTGILLFFALASFSYTKPGKANSQESLKKEAVQTLRIAANYIRSISYKGGYAGIYRKDLKKQYSERLTSKMKENTIWVQPPGTPSVGLVFLRAYKITKDKFYLDSAIAAGLALAWGQSTKGGWEYCPKIDHLEKGKKVKRKKTKCTFDDNNTQEALNFLICLDEIYDAQWLTESIELGLAYILKGQYENGAWPQWYPLRGSYHDYYTFNDNAINDCIRVMIKAYQVYKKKEYLTSALKGGEFIIISPVSKDQPGWAQQYSKELKPVWARKFEPPAVCSLVTARNIKTLVDLYLFTKDKKFLTPVPAAIKWLERSKISNNIWARMYELESNRPIYGDRDRKIHYTIEEISMERQLGYTWQRDFEVPPAIKYYNEAKNTGKGKYVDQLIKPEDIPTEVKRIISALDKKERWLGSIKYDDDNIYIGTFVNNMNELCRFLE